MIQNHFFSSHNVARLSILILFCGACFLCGMHGTAAQEPWGHLKGKLVVKGDAPQPAQLDLGTNPDKEYCLVGGQNPVDQNLKISKDNELADVLVMMFLAAGEEEPAYHPSYAAAKEKPAELDNKECCFVPQALFVRTGQKLLLKNSDAIGHNCHIITFNNEHNINIPAGSNAEITLENPERAPGEVKCDIHPWMSSVIMVRDNPYVAFSDAEGQFTIENIPAGKWKFQFWHKKVGWMRTLEIEGYEVGRRGEIEVEIKPGETLDLSKLLLPADSIK